MKQKVCYALIIALTLGSILRWSGNKISYTPTKVPAPSQQPITQPTPPLVPASNPKPNTPSTTIRDSTVTAAVPSNTPAKTQQAQISSSHPNYPYTAMVSTQNPLYAMEPFVGRLSAPAGLTATTTSSTANPVIAVIDTGFGLKHDNLKAAWSTNPNEIGTTSVGSVQSCTNQGMTLDKRCNNYDNDGDGYLSNWRGWDFVNNDNDPSAGTSNPSGASVMHGTLTSSLAFVLDPSVKIMPLQALDDSGQGYTDTVAAAVRYAADHGATVISLSLGSPYDDAYLRAQIDYAINKGVVVVAAAGNSGCNCLSYPAAYPEVLSVGATDGSDNLASFSSYGSNLNVVAPGTAGDVCGALWTSTNPTSSYSCGYSGTSFATPIVASLASLIQIQSPTAAPSEVIRLITQNTDKPTGMGGASRTPQYGYGRINIYKSILAASLATPQGQLLNKTSASLSSSTLALGPLLDSSCQGQAGASCDIRITSSDGNTVYYLGAQTLDQYGGANFIWNAATLGLTPGQWSVTSVITYLGQTTIKPPVILAVSD